MFQIMLMSHELRENLSLDLQHISCHSSDSILMSTMSATIAVISLHVCFTLFRQYVDRELVRIYWSD